MEMMKAIAMRKSARSYKPEQISDESLKNIINAGCAAPVGRGMYDTVHLTVIQDSEILKKISSTAANVFGTPSSDPLYGAPTFVLVSCIPNKQFPNIELANAACVIENMALAATDAGLGSVYILGALCAFSADQTLIKELNLPEGFVPVSGIVLGYPTEPLTHEKELKQIIKTNVIK